MARFTFSAITGILLGVIFGLGTALTLVAQTMDQLLDVWELMSIIVASHFAGCATTLFVFSICYFWKPLCHWVAEGVADIAAITKVRSCGRKPPAERVARAP